MKTSTVSLCLSLLATLTSAQTPKGFPEQTDQTLTVDYQSTDTTIKAGTMETEYDVAKAPTLFAPKGKTDGTFVAIMVDATYPYLHLIAPNLVANSGNGKLSTSDNGDKALVGADYLSPAPPASDGPHEYVIMLYEQPDNWAIPGDFDSVNPPATKNARSGFDIANFVGESGLTTLVGANYFNVKPDSMNASPTGNASPSAASASASATAKGSSTNAASAFQLWPVYWLLTGALLLRAF